MLDEDGNGVGNVDFEEFETFFVDVLEPVIEMTRMLELGKPGGNLLVDDSFEDKDSHEAKDPVDIDVQFDELRAVKGQLAWDQEGRKVTWDLTDEEETRPKRDGHLCSTYSNPTGSVTSIILIQP